MMTTRQNLFRWLASCALTAAMVLTPALAADTAAGKAATPKSTPVVEPMADRVLRAATDLLKNARGFTVETNVSYDELLGTGIMVQYSRHGTVTVRRPDRIYAEVTDDLSERRLWFDGKTATVYRPARNLYVQAKVPGSIDEFVDTLHDQYGVAAPFADVLVNDPYANFTEGLYAGYYAGLNLVNRERAHHLVFTNENVDFQLWVAESGKPLLKRAVITFKNQEGSPQWMADFLSWDFGAKTPDSTFTFTPPDGAEQIEFLSRTSAGGAQQ
jgi:hypothetical protein